MKQFYISWKDADDEVEYLSDLQDLHHIGFNKLNITREDTSNSKEPYKSDNDTRFIGFDEYNILNNSNDKDDSCISGMEIEPLGLVYHFEFHDTKEHIDKEFKMTSWKEVLKFLIDYLKITEKYEPKSQDSENKQ